MNKQLITFAAATLILGACSNNKTEVPEPVAETPVNIIFETDMGNDVDDALALTMLHNYIDQGKVNLLAIGLNKESDGSARYVDILNSYYGHPDIPVGVIHNGAFCGDANNYAQAVAEMKGNDGQLLFTGSGADVTQFPETPQLYRRVLSEAPDSSVTLVSVGFSTNLARLLASEPDSISPLSGRDLIAKKVKNTVLMAGHSTNPEYCEYNVVRDPDAARPVFTEWPTPVVTSPFEVGLAIEYPATSIENDFAWSVGANPVVEGYKAYLPMPYDRPTWDLTSVLYAVEGPEGYFTVSEPQSVEVGPQGQTTFTPAAEGNVRYLSTDSVQNAAILARFLELVPYHPGH